MKACFSKNLENEENGMKMNREYLKRYFAVLDQELLASNQCPDYVRAAAEVSDECFDDVWYEMDFNETGFITWHQVKSFMSRVMEHEEELRVERDRLEAIR